MALNATCLDNLGSPTIYAWISVIKEFLEARKGQDIVDSRPVNVPECFVEAVAPSIDDVPTIYHGEVFTDRKSHFQAHLARVSSKEEVKLVLDRLYENSKISRATHNIYAYRITEERNGREIR
ncbi:hypothetical protein COOONC_17932 [Cooperia oncophora]